MLFYGGLFRIFSSYYIKSIFFYMVNNSVSNTVVVVCQMLLVFQPGEILICRFMNLHSYSLSMIQKMKHL